MDVHDIALRLYIQLVGVQRVELVSEQARIELALEAYRYAEAYVLAKDSWIREQPVPVVDDQF